MNLDVFRTHDPSGKMARESYVSKNHTKEYEYIISKCEYDIPFKEKVYMVLNNIEDLPKCKNTSCNKLVKFKNTSIGYLNYCSNRCIGSDPNIIETKQKKSIEKFGTKTPAESTIIKDKIIKTNNNKYGGNSPMSSKETQDKSKETLLKNWGVDNPSKNKDIINKRIESFKCNIEQYKDSYKKTSLMKYGVEHPWMNRNIHNKTIDSFYEDYRNRINNKIDNNEFEFIKFDKNITTKLVFNCKKCNNEFDILTYQFYYRVNNLNSICTKCHPISDSSSIDQTELFNLIRSNYDGTILQNVRDVIKPYEIDIYLPDIKVGFEFNGVFWHSDRFKDINYHLRKYETASKNDIKVYTIWEDDWTLKRDIVKSFVLNKIGKTNNRVFARKCKIKEIDYNTSRKFLDENHLQGDCKSSKRIALYYNDIIVSLMTFSKLRLPVGGKNNNINTYELTRFCNLRNYSIVGGASKLIRFFIEKYEPSEIQTYSDNLISSGDLYNTLGFTYKHTSKPGYWYLIDGIRSHRFNWRKDKLTKMGYDSSKTEEEIMSEMGYYKIYNGGNKKWVYTIEK